MEGQENTGDQQQGQPNTGDATGQQQGGTAGQQLGNGGQGNGEKTFTQAELDAIVRDRLDRQKRATESQAQRDREAAEAQALEEQSKFRELAEQRQQRVLELEAESERAQIAHRETLVRMAIDREATKQGAVDPDAVFALMDRAAIAIDDDGTVTGADKAVKALLDAKPYLKATNGHGGPPQTPRPDNGQLSEEERRRRAVGIKQLW